MKFSKQLYKSSFWKPMFHVHQQRNDPLIDYLILDPILFRFSKPKRSCRKQKDEKKKKKKEGIKIIYRPIKTEIQEENTNWSDEEEEKNPQWKMHHGLAAAPVRCNADEAIRILFTFHPLSPTLPSVFLVPSPHSPSSEQQNWTWFRHATRARGATTVLHFLEHWAGSLVIPRRIAGGQHRWNVGGFTRCVWKNRNSQKGFWGEVMWSRFQGFSDNWMRRTRCIAMGFRNGIECTKRSWKVPTEGGGRGLRTRIVREGGRKGRRGELPAWDGGRKLIIFRLPGVTMAFCAFEGWGCFLGGVGVWRARLIWLGGSPSSCWFSFWDRERERKSWLVERLYWRDNEMLLE